MQIWEERINYHVKSKYLQIFIYPFSYIYLCVIENNEVKHKRVYLLQKSNVYNGDDLGEPGSFYMIPKQFTPCFCFLGEKLVQVIVSASFPIIPSFCIPPCNCTSSTKGFRAINVNCERIIAHSFPIKYTSHNDNERIDTISNVYASYFLIVVTILNIYNNWSSQWSFYALTYSYPL